MPGRRARVLPLIVSLLLAAGCGDDATDVSPVSSTAPGVASSAAPNASPTTTSPPTTLAATSTVGTARPPVGPTTTMAGLALEPPPQLPVCRAADLGGFEQSMGLWFLRFANTSGRTCGLAGFATLEGRSAGGEWQVVPTEPLNMPASTGPPWIGAFTTDLVAVLSVRAPATCSSTAAVRRHETTRLVLPNGGGAIELGLPVEVSGCPLRITPFSADSQDP